MNNITIEIDRLHQLVSNQHQHPLVALSKTLPTPIGVQNRDD